MHHRLDARAHTRRLARVKGIAISEHASGESSTLRVYLTLQVHGSPVTPLIHTVQVLARLLYTTCTYTRMSSITDMDASPKYGECSKSCGGPCPRLVLLL